MVFAISISLFFSLIAILSYVSDMFLGSLYPIPVIAVSLGSAVFFAAGYAGDVLSRRREGALSGQSAAWKEAALFSAVFIMLYCYYIAPSLPGCLPLSLFWDGANHLFLIDFLTSHENHRMMAESLIAPAWGGRIYMYPWGMHAAFAALSRVTGIDAAFLIHPVLSLIFAAIGTSWASFITRFRVSRGALIAVFFVLIFSHYSLYYLIEYNYWTQALGILISLSIAFSFEMRSQGKQFSAILPVLLVGLMLVYPYYFPAMYIGSIVYMAAKDKFKSRRELVVMAAIGLIFYIQVDTSGYMVQEILSRRGPSHSRPLGAFLIFLAVSLLAVPEAVRQLFRERRYYFIFPIMVFCMAGAIEIMGLLKCVRLEIYWVCKLAFINMILLLPALGAFFDSVTNALVKYIQDSSRIRTLFVLAAAVFFLALFPVARVSDIKPALTSDEYKMRAWTEKITVGEGRVYYVESPYKKSWLAAVAKKPAIVFAKDFRQAAIRLREKYDTKKELTDIFESARSGDLVVMDRSVGRIARELKPECFMFVHAEGDVELYRYIYRG